MLTDPNQKFFMPVIFKCDM